MARNKERTVRNWCAKWLNRLTQFSAWKRRFDTLPNEAARNADLVRDTFRSGLEDAKADRRHPENETVDAEARVRLRRSAWVMVLLTVFTAYNLVTSTDPFARVVNGTLTMLFTFLAGCCLLVIRNISRPRDRSGR